MAELANSIEGRAQSDNGTLIEPLPTDVAACTITNVYPAPTEVIFVVGGEHIAVPIEEPEGMCCLLQ